VEHSGIPGQVGRSADPVLPPATPNRLPRPYRVTVRVAVLGVGLAVTMFVGVLFLTVAPRNAISARYAAALHTVVAPEFAQRWQVFAPDPLWSNLQMEVRAQLTGEGAVTDWFNVSAGDVAALRSDPAPARRLVNELRNAWDWYWQTHDGTGRAVGRSGEIAEQYLRRLALGRLDGAEVAGTIDRIQVRVLHKMVTPPAWTKETVPAQPDIRELPWWPVSAADRPAGASRELSIAG
jgi:hypothetical protein